MSSKMSMNLIPRLLSARIPAFILILILPLLSGAEGKNSTHKEAAGIQRLMLSHLEVFK